MNLLRISLAVLALSLPPRAAAQGAVFSFVDASGALQISNVDEQRAMQAQPEAAAITLHAAQAKPGAERQRQRESGDRAIIA
jgi:hypothetical protein